MRCTARSIVALLVLVACGEERAQVDAPGPGVVEAVVVAAPVGVATPVIARVEDTAKLEVIARLVEPQSAPHCGVAHFVVVMRYEVVRVVEGSYAGSELWVAHRCPELSATACAGVEGQRIRGYEKGDRHQMRVERRRGSGALIDKFADRTAPRYWARCAARVSGA